MNASEFFGFGSHSELVQLATDLLSETPDTELWLPQYDAALESEDDMSLVRFCWAIWTKDQRKIGRVARDSEYGATGHEAANAAIETPHVRVQRSSQQAA
jgi:hypothetical protein